MLVTRLNLRHGYDHTTLGRKIVPKKKTDTKGIAALVIGIAAGAGVYWLLPDAHWAVPVGVGLVMTTVLDSDFWIGLP